MYTDSHTHLNSPQLFPDYKNHIQDFLEQGGVGLSIIGTHLEDSIMGIEICETIVPLYPSLMIGVTIGYHPEFARDCNIDTLEKLITKYNGGIKERRSLDSEATDSHLASGGQQGYTTNSKIQSGGSQPIIIGIGEIGTDLYRKPYHAFYEEQKKAFYDQCLLALQYHLPIIIHSRNDFAGTMDILHSVILSESGSSLILDPRDRENKKPLYPFKIYFHCRGYTTKELETLHMFIKNNQNLELYIGFCGNISYPKAQDLRDSFAYCLDHDINILIETDAPYLAAQAIRGQENTPAKIIYTYEYVSDYFHIPLEDLQKKTHGNFMSLYYPTSVIPSGA